MLDVALTRLSRLEAVVGATSGVLHDVNNLLTVLSGNLFLLTEAVHDDESVFKRCCDARLAADHAGAIIRELLTSRQSHDDSSAVICPAEHVVAIEGLLRRTVGPRHTLTTSADPHPWHVEASAVQFESAVINFVLNAYQAMAAGGTIDIHIDNVANADDSADLPPGEFVRIRVSDSGPGIPARVLTRTCGFDSQDGAPERDQGFGLGLRMIRRFAAQAGGVMKLANEEAKGARAELWLPRCARRSSGSDTTTVPLSTLPRGSEKVLVAMADAEVANTVESLLDAMGYSVVKADDRREALEVARVHRDLNLIICNRTASGVSSDRRWLARLRGISPDIRQIAIVDHGDDFDDVAPDANACVHHPVAVPTLAQAMREAMEDKP